MKILDWEISGIAGSIFRECSSKARATLDSDAFIILLTYDNCGDFDIQLDQSHGIYNLSYLYERFKSILPEFCEMANNIHDTRRLLSSDKSEISSKLFDLLKAAEIVISPLVFEGLGCGLACWIWKKPTSSGTSEITKANLIAEQIALSFRAAISEKQSRQQNEKLKAILDLSRALYSCLDYEEVIRKAVDISMNILGCDGGAIFWKNKIDEIYEPLIIIDNFFPDAPLLYGSKLGDGIIKKTIDGGRGIFETHQLDADLSADSGNSALENNIICVPLGLAEEYIGAIALWSHTGKSFNNSDLEFLTIYARQISIAIENAQLYVNLKRANQEITSTQEQLIMAEKLKALGEMAGGVAHEFNNVLGTILGRTQLLQRKMDDTSAIKNLEIIEKVTLESRRVVQRLQDFTHVSSQSEFEVMNINEAVMAAIESTRPAWKDISQRKGITINLIQNFKEIPPINGNFEELKESFTNVILNSIDALPQGGNIWLRTYSRDEKVCVEIADDGIGMDESVKNKLFYPFFSTKQERGSGMGLAIVYGILFRHQADIGVESSPGKGAVFTFRFGISLESKAESVVLPVLPQPDQLKILLVDDDLQLLDVVSDMLDILGHSVKKAPGGWEAIEAMKIASFDLVITDLGMPEIGGWEVARYCRTEHPSTPILLISGWGAQINNQEAKQRVDAVLSKPFKLEEIKDTIANVMASKTQKQPA